MPVRDTPPIGAPCWVDLMSSDTERTRDFYGSLFGWHAEEPAEEFGGYFNFTKHGARVAGCMSRQPDSAQPDAWSVYLASDDASKTVEAVVASGGEIAIQPMAVGQLGTMAFATDPGGAAVGVWQPGEHVGFTVIGEPGTPNWFELQTRDYEATLAFYRHAFRWDTQVLSDTPEFRYTTQMEGETMLAGVMDAAAMLPEGVPSRWSVYFGADDTDAALATTVDLGGSVVMSAEDTPYGRLAVAVDATGAQFKLVGPNESMPAT